MSATKKKLDKQLPPDTCNWTTEHVEVWLKENRFGQYSELFCKKHKIDGTALLTLTEKDLKQPPLEINVLGDIKRLSICLQKLKLEQNDSAYGIGLGDYAKISRDRFWQPREVQRLDSETSTISETDLFEHQSQISDNKIRSSRMCQNLKPEYKKLLLSFIYMFSVFLITAVVMVIVHDRVPDMDKYPPLPDIVLDNLPYIPWAFEMTEITGMILLIVWCTICAVHKHRFIIMRRTFALTGTVFMLRCITMLITSLSVPGRHLQCHPKMYGSPWSKVERAITIWKGFGMSLQGVRTCGDYMFSGHTVVVTMLNFFITEYTPRRMYLLHTATWVLNIFGIFFILAAHEHYSIDVFVAFYITSRLFLYYHTLANNRALKQPDRKRTRIWFPLFSFFESQCAGIIPNEYESPLTALKNFFMGEKKQQ